MKTRSVLWAVVTVFFFSALLALAQEHEGAVKPQAPCSAPENRQFDFWLGEWDVTANDKHAGTNRVTSILGGCVIMEEWQGAGPYSGKSFNRYDPVSGQWQQFWVDNRGGVLRLSGTYQDRKMILTGRSAVAGENVRDRITWFNNEDGTVRQVWEQSKDDGGTWSTIFDGLYVKKK